MDNDERLNKIKNRQKRYGLIVECPKCHMRWFHEDEDYIINFDSFDKKIQCPYCKILLVINEEINNGINSI